MTRKFAFALTALALTLATGVTAAFAGTGGAAADPGVTATSILLGATSPLTGPASAYASVARGADAYFKYVNARGGVNGRKIQYKILDDGYNPAQTVQRDAPARRAGQRVRDLQRARHRAEPRRPRLPQRPEGAAALRRVGRDDVRPETAKYPYTIGLPAELPGGRLGATGSTWRARSGAAKVAVLFQNDDYGKDLLNGLKKGIQRSSVKVVAAQPYEVDGQSTCSPQIVKLRSSGANTFAVFATPKFAIQAYVYREQARLEAQAVLTTPSRPPRTSCSSRPRAARTSSWTARSRSSSSRTRPTRGGRTTPP